jgi:hypothetical protein
MHIADPTRHYHIQECDDFVKNDEFCVENANNLDDEAEIESFFI